MAQTLEHEWSHGRLKHINVGGCGAVVALGPEPFALGAVKEWQWHVLACVAHAAWAAFVLRPLGAMCRRRVFTDSRCAVFHVGRLGARGVRAA